MKKFTAYFGAMMLMWLGVTAESNAQAIRDRQVVPVAVNLNQILRMKIINGGNIEFVFNTIDDYKRGLSGEWNLRNSAGYLAAFAGAYGATHVAAGTNNILMQTSIAAAANVGQQGATSDVLNNQGGAGGSISTANMSNNGMVNTIGMSGGNNYTVQNYGTTAGTNGTSYLGNSSVGYVGDETPVPPGWDAAGLQEGTYIATTPTAGGQHVAGNFYRTTFTVASSTSWMLEMGAEEPHLTGTDDEGREMELNNVGFSLREFGIHDWAQFNDLTAANDLDSLGYPQGWGDADSTLYGNAASGELISPLTLNGLVVVGLEQFPSRSPLIRDNDRTGSGSNAGSEEDNAFELVWRCGTSEVYSSSVADGNNSVSTWVGLPMKGASILEQNIEPDRYVTNVLFELSIDY